MNRNRIPLLMPTFEELRGFTPMKFRFIKRAKYKIGDRVVLPEDRDMKLGQEVGTITEVENQKKHPGMYILQLDDEFLFDIDDGVREVHIDTISGLYLPSARDLTKALQLMGFAVSSAHDHPTVKDVGSVYLPHDIWIQCAFGVSEFRAIRYFTSPHSVTSHETPWVSDLLSLAAEMNKLFEPEQRARHDPPSLTVIQGGKR